MKIFYGLYYGLVLWLILGIASYSELDASLFHLYSASSTHNFGGILGAIIGGSLFELLGLLAYLVPALLLWLPKLYGQELWAKLWRALWLIGLCSALLGTVMHWLSYNQIAFYSGIFGIGFARWSEQTTGLPLGATLVLVCMAILSLRLKKLFRPQQEATHDG